MRLVAPVTRGYVFLSALCEPSVSIPDRILLEMLFPGLHFFNASFNALTSSFITFQNLDAISALRRMDAAMASL